MRIYYTNLNKRNQVTGTCHYLQIEFDNNPKNNANILVDMGMTQDGTLSFAQLYEINGRPYNVDFKELTSVIITHQHADHCGNLSRLIPLGYEGNVITTALSAEYIALNLRDICKIHTSEVDAYNDKKKNTRYKYIPLITNKTTEDIISRIHGYGFNEEIKINDNVTVELVPNGHIGGSAFALMTFTDGKEKKRLLFSGDTSCYREIPFTKLPNFNKNLKVNFICGESTYGDRIIPDNDIQKELKKHIIETCIQKNKDILIPAFSIGRGTAVLWHLKKVFDDNPQFKDISVCLGSPMLAKAHRIALNPKNQVFYDDKWDTDELSEWKRVEYIEDFKLLQKKINDKSKPKIFVLSSGMLGEGGFSSYAMIKFLPKKDYKILIVGYQCINSTGRQLLEGTQKSVTAFDMGKKVVLPVRCKVDKIDGMSSHSDYKQMCDFYGEFQKTKINKFIITHGQNESKEYFSKILKKKFNTSEILIPKYNERIKIL